RGSSVNRRRRRGTATLFFPTAGTRRVLLFGRPNSPPPVNNPDGRSLAVVAEPRLLLPPSGNLGSSRRGAQPPNSSRRLAGPRPRGPLRQSPAPRGGFGRPGPSQDLDSSQRLQSVGVGPRHPPILEHVRDPPALLRRQPLAQPRPEFRVGRAAQLLERRRRRL